MGSDKTEVVWVASVGWGGKIIVAHATVKRSAKNVTVLECSDNHPFGFKTRLQASEVSASRTEAIQKLIESLHTKLDDLDKKSKQVRQNIEKAEAEIEETK